MNEQVGMGIWAIGILMWLLGYIMLLRQAFAKGGNWGWLMLIPPFLVIVSPLFGIQFWPEARSALYLFLCGFGLAWLGVLIAGALGNPGYR